MPSPCLRKWIFCETAEAARYKNQHKERHKVPHQSDLSLARGADLSPLGQEDGEARALLPDPELELIVFLHEQSSHTIQHMSSQKVHKADDNILTGASGAHGWKTALLPDIRAANWYSGFRHYEFQERTILNQEATPKICP